MFIQGLTSSVVVEDKLVWREVHVAITAFDTFSSRRIIPTKKKKKVVAIILLCYNDYSYGNKIPLLKGLVIFFKNALPL